MIFIIKFWFDYGILNGPFMNEFYFHERMDVDESFKIGFIKFNDYTHC